MTFLFADSDPNEIAHLAVASRILEVCLCLLVLHIDGLGTNLSLDFFFVPVMLTVQMRMFQSFVVLSDVVLFRPRLLYLFNDHYKLKASSFSDFLEALTAYEFLIRVQSDEVNPAIDTS